MQTLAHMGGGPGPWILFFPLIWAAVIVGIVLLLRRTVWRGRGPRRGPDEQSPITALGLRFAAGEIDEDEYARRLSVLDKRFGRTGDGKTGGAA